MSEVLFALLTHLYALRFLIIEEESSPVDFYISMCFRLKSGGKSRC